MPTRIEIELTSAAADGSWTWRAAGARQPRGVLDGSILPADASVGDQLKAESEHDVDGIRILSIIADKPKAERPGILELLPTDDFEPVTQQRARRDPRDRRDRGEGGRGRPRRDRRDGAGGDRRDGRPGRDRRGHEGRDGRGVPDGRERRDGRPGGERERDRDGRHRPHFTPPPELPQRPKPKRLRPGKQRRNEVLVTIPEEQRPVAELTLQGLAAVRQRVREDNAKLAAEGKPTMPEATVLKMAEDLLPRLRVADWLDRAEAAKRQLAHLDLRDLRSVVAAADDPAVARDESTRELAAELKAALTTKQDEEFALWLGDVEANVDVGRVVRALRLSAMPPKAGVRFPPPLGAKLAEATTAALGSDDPADRWVAVLEAAAFSPVRTAVTPAAAPTESHDELVATVKRLGPLLPQVAALFGIDVPPDAPAPKPLRPAPRRREDRKSSAEQPKPPRQRNRPATATPSPAAAHPATTHADAAATGDAPPAEPPAAAESPAADTSADEPAAAESPAADTSAEVNPPGAAPVDAEPVDETPVDEQPVDAAPVEDAPVEDAPAEDAPIDAAPVDDAPVEDRATEADERSAGTG